MCVCNVCVCVMCVCVCNVCVCVCVCVSIWTCLHSLTQVTNTNNSNTVKVIHTTYRSTHAINGWTKKNKEEENNSSDKSYHTWCVTKSMPVNHSRSILFKHLEQKQLSNIKSCSVLITMKRFQHTHTINLIISASVENNIFTSNLKIDWLYLLKIHFRG